MNIEPNYIHIKTINGPIGQLLVSQLRAEGIDLRLINSNSSSIYPLDTFGTRLEVNINDKARALKIIADIEKTSLAPNPDLEFHDADEADIAFEKEMNEREERIKNAKPPILIYVLMLVILVSTFYFATLK